MILRTLGGLTLEGIEFRRPKPLLLLAYLAVEGPTERRYLAELFWHSAANPRRSLTTALTQLRSGAPDAVGTNDVRVWCNVESDSMQLLRAVEDRDWLRAVEIYRGPFLEGLELSREGVELEEWAYVTRERMAHGMRAALLALGERAAADDRFDDAGTWVGRARGLSESAPPERRDLGRLYRLLLATNRPDLGRLRADAVALDLDVPSTVAEARSSLRADVAATATRHLPVRATTFVGRQRELEALGRLVTDDRSRLVSLVGPGGAGKTRLALELAHRQSEAGTWRGVHFVALETASRAERVAPALADALGIRLNDDQDASLQVQQAIRDAAYLIVLDNFEHLIPAATMLSGLVRACPNVRLVVTSRETLGLTVEHTVPLGGLAVPGDGDTSAENARRWDAVALFVQRATRVRPDFSLEDAPVAAVLRICRSVGGLPLAIEMAAAWVRAMTCTEIADELGESLHLLEGHHRDGSDRHRSIRVVFEQSWKLFTRDERTVGAELAVFRGGFDREAAATVAGASMSRLAALLDRSLLMWDGSGRYHLHPLLRQFLEEKARLAPDRSLDMRERHARYYLARLESLQATFPRRDSAKAAAEIESDLPNFLAAWEWAAREGRCDLLEPAIHALGWFYLLRGRPQEGLDWSELRVHEESSSLLELRRLLWQGLFLDELGRGEEATGRVQQSARSAEQIGATPDQAFAFRLMGIIDLKRQPFNADRVAAAFRRAYALYDALDDVEGQAMMLNNLAALSDDSTQALEMLTDARRIARDAGETHALAMTSGTFATILMLYPGDYLGARSAAEESVACHQATGASLMTALSSMTLGEVLVMLGDLEGAQTLALQALDLCDTFHTSVAHSARGAACALLGTVERIRGHTEAAAEHYREALHHLAAAPNPRRSSWWAATSMNGLTRIALADGRAVDARRHADRAIAFLAEHSTAKDLEIAAMQLASLAQLGEALALQGQLEASEERLQTALQRAREEQRVPAVLGLLLALAELHLQRGASHHARDAVAAVAQHPASPYELTQRAGMVLTDLAATGSQPRIGAIALADALELMAGGGSRLGS